MRIRLSEDEKLQLKGRIYRLDLCEDEEHIYVKIIDYNQGAPPLTWRPFITAFSFSWWCTWMLH